MLIKENRLGMFICHLLLKDQMTGYDISVFCKSSMLPWQHQQIYRELKKLEEKGCIFYRLVPQEGKPDKKIFSLTEMGLEYLQQLKQLEPTLPDSSRDALMIHLAINNRAYVEKYLALSSERVAEIQHMEYQERLPNILRLALSREKALLNADIKWISTVTNI